jgi:hypothetical protein
MLGTLYYIAIALILLVVVYEVLLPRTVKEGFEDRLVGVADSAQWAKWAPRRGDIGIDPEYEETGYVRGWGNFAGYVDIQRIGQRQDFCRVVAPKGRPDDRFVACGLGGTDGLSTLDYRSPSESEGFRISRDDYMHDVNGDGRDDYCRILKTSATAGGEFEIRANVSEDLAISARTTTDPNPPDAAAQLLDFYSGVLIWFRFLDDMLDYAQNIDLRVAGKAEVEEYPPIRTLSANGEDPDIPRFTRGLEFNGVDQFLKIGERPDMEFGQSISLRNVRSWSMWVRFDEFTNNARIFDFGNGAGKDNVWLGIFGRGSQGASGEPLRPLLCGGGEVVPDSPSGAQPVEEVSPQEAMRDSAANTDKYVCPEPGIIGRRMKPLFPKAPPRGGIVQTADLVYEIWDSSQRVMRVVLPSAVKLGQWTHIAITATSGDSWRPNIDFYINGRRVTTKESGFLPQTDFVQKNYLGKSNWSDVTSKYANKDELFKGAMFDFRAYNQPMSAGKICDTIAWGKKFLGLTSGSN